MEYPYYNEKVIELKRGSKIGYCRICDNFKKLTIDHIPPKACGNVNRIIIGLGKKTIISQNGLNCKTICHDCNSNLLGLNYDKVLIKLYNQVISLSKDIVPAKMEFDVNVNGLVRCLLGHMLAINVNDDQKTVADILSRENRDQDNAPIYEMYRKFVLGITDTLDNISCYYWYYPYNEIIVIPYFFKAKTDFVYTIYQKTLFGTLFKCFPIAIYLVDDSVSTSTINLNKMDFSINKLIFDFKDLVHVNYPEKPLENEIIGVHMGSSIEIINKDCK